MEKIIKRLALPRLSLQERDRRWNAVRKETRQRRLDCLVVRGHSGKWDSFSANVRYLTHIGGNGEENIVMFPLEGDPTCYVWAGTFMIEWWRRAQDWTGDLRGGSMIWSKNIVDWLKEHGLESGRIGIVGFGGLREPEGVFSYETFINMQQALPKTEFVNATDILENLRLIKSQEEIKMHEKAAELADLAVEAMRDTARPGLEEYVVYAEMVHAMLKNGGEYPPMLIWEAGPQPFHAARFPTARRLEPGDIILNEITAKYCGYWAHPHHPMAIGEPEKEYIKMAEISLEAFHCGLAALRPGVTLQEWDDAITEPVSKAGYTWVHPPFHGLGLEEPEYPWGSIPGMPGGFIAELTIAPGMVFALQPNVVRKDKTKGIAFGDTVVVTETGGRRLGKRKMEFIMV